MQQEVTQLGREVAKLKAERDILGTEIGPAGPPVAVKTVRYMVSLRGVAEGFLVDWIPLKNVALGLLRT